MDDAVDKEGGRKRREMGRGVTRQSKVGFQLGHRAWVVRVEGGEGKAGSGASALGDVVAELGPGVQEPASHSHTGPAAGSVGGVVTGRVVGSLVGATSGICC